MLQSSTALSLQTAQPQVRTAVAVNAARCCSGLSVVKLEAPGAKEETSVKRWLSPHLCHRARNAGPSRPMWRGFRVLALEWNFPGRPV